MFYHFYTFFIVIFMKIHFCIPLYTWNSLVFLLSLVFKNSPHITYRFCKMKTMLIVGREVTEGGSVNPCTTFCSFKSRKRQNLNFNDHRIMQYLSFITTKASWNTSLMLGGIKSSSNTQPNHSSCFLGNHLEMLYQ